MIPTTSKNFGAKSQKQPLRWRATENVSWLPTLKSDTKNVDYELF